MVPGSRSPTTVPSSDSPVEKVSGQLTDVPSLLASTSRRTRLLLARNPVTVVVQCRAVARIASVQRRDTGGAGGTAVGVVDGWRRSGGWRRSRGGRRSLRGARHKGGGCGTVWPDFRRPWADAGLLTDVAAGRPPHALARHVGTRPPHVACAHVGVSQPAGEKRPSARTPAGPGPRRSVAARPIAQARTRSRLICERGACAYQLRKPGLAAAARGRLSGRRRLRPSLPGSSTTRRRP